MKKYIIIAGIIMLSIGAYFLAKPKKYDVDIVQISGPDDPIFKDGSHVMVWDKNGKVINPEGFKKLLGGEDSIQYISTPLNGVAVYRFNETDGKWGKQEVYKQEHYNEKFTIVFNNDTIRRGNDFIAQISVNDITEQEYTLIVNHAENYTMEKKQFPAYTRVYYKAAMDNSGVNTFSGKLLLNKKEHLFQFDFFVIE